MHSIRKIKDSFMNAFHSIIGIFNILIVILIFIFILFNSISFFREYPITKFLTGTEWISLSDKYGFLPLLVGSFWVTFVALAISVPIGITTTIYLSEFANKKTKKILKIVIETMSALPS
ncbi:MAG: phosphate ABC transporter permease subunit PstC, partial [Cetobacterium sp.]